MVDATFLSTYKGSLYPVPLTDPAPSRNKPLLSPPRLLDTCCQMLVMDSAFTLRAVEQIPQSLIVNLMRAALEHSRDRAIEVLVSRWPWRVLSVSKLTAPLFDDVRVLYDEEYLRARLRRGVRITTCLGHTFVQCLKNREPTKLRCLDMSGYPTAEVIIEYLSSHVLLVSNEKRQREIITMYNEIAQALENPDAQKFDVDSTFPEDCYLVVLDACVTSQALELGRALKACRDGASRLLLRPSSLDLSCVGVPRICVLLEQIEPQYVRGLCLQYNSLHTAVLSLLVPALRPLSGLVSLDLASNNLRLSVCPVATSLLATLFTQLPLLQRLDLSNNAVAGCVAELLGSLRPLTFLRLCACLLAPADLNYLAASPHALSLEELDLSENDLSRVEAWPAVRTLLTTAPRLAAVELEHTRLTVYHVLEVLTVDDNEDGDRALTAACASRLRYINLSRNPLTSACMVRLVPRLSLAPHLRAIKTSYPGELYAATDDPSDMEVAMEQFVLRMATLAADVVRPPRTQPLTVVWECS